MKVNIRLFTCKFILIVFGSDSDGRNNSLGLIRRSMKTFVKRNRLQAYMLKWWELDEEHYVLTDSKRGGLSTFQDTVKFLRYCSPHSERLKSPYRNLRGCNAQYAAFLVSWLPVSPK